jgi:hypothetical protein
MPTFTKDYWKYHLITAYILIANKMLIESDTEAALCSGNGFVVKEYT